jgi:hypothetical protein
VITRKEKCDLCDNIAFVWYWYGSPQRPNSLAMCSHHQGKVRWIAPYCFRIERKGHETVEKLENAYSRKRAGESSAVRLTRHEPRASDDPVRECLIDSIIEALPLMVSRRLFDVWSLDELKRFSPLQVAQKQEGLE